MPEALLDTYVGILPKTEKTSRKLPNAKLTFNEVKQKVDENRGTRPSCPDAVVKAILKQGDPEQKILEMKAALNEIAKIAHADWPDWVLQDLNDQLNDDKIAPLFTRFPRECIEIAKNAGDGASAAFSVLRSDKVGPLFASYPTKFVELSKIEKRVTYVAMSSIGEITALEDIFIQNPDQFLVLAKILDFGSLFANELYESKAKVTEEIIKPNINKLAEIAEYAGELGYNGLSALYNPTVKQLFDDHPREFVRVAEVMKRSAYSVFYALRYEETRSLFLDYCDNRIPFEKFILIVMSLNQVAIEIGRPLDDLHFQENERKKYLENLTTLQVFALLNSNPSFFFTSSNHMLFDRLKEDLNGKSVVDLFEQYGLIGTDLCRNFLLRTINYGRFYGQENSLFTSDEVEKLLPTLINPMSSGKFNPTYFFLFANAIDKTKGIELINNAITPILEKNLKSHGEDSKFRAALEYLVYSMNEKTTAIPEEKKQKIRNLEIKSIYEPTLYKNDGKLTVLQIFDKADSGQYHWPLTQKEFADYFDKNPVPGKNGELIFENNSLKMILFMGESSEINKEFLEKQLDRTPNAIITFRGHSYSLTNNFPYDIFQNKDNHILFIPGSCGSAGSTAEYIMANPRTDIQFVSNNSTGKGQVTNAIIKELLESKEQQFNKILQESARLEGYGTDIQTLRVWDKGEILLRYVLQNQ